MSQYDDSYHHDEEPETPGAVSWFFQQIGWYLRKLILWPIADSCRAVGRGISRLFDPFRHRSPLAYIGTTLAVTVTAGAVAAAVYFYNQSEKRSDPVAPVVAQQAAVPAQEPAVPPQAAVPDRSPQTTAGDDQTLQGVVPNFDRTAATQKTDGTDPGRSKQKTVVKPSPTPDSGPLRVAHRFAASFVGYEVGEKKAARRLGETALPGLARELKANPPKLPANGTVPKASVMNVVKGKRSGKRLEVSVALLRSGATSELRLGLKHTPDGWRVSGVRG